MTEQEREFIKGHLEDYLQRKGIDTRKPFNCLNPAHPDKHPSMSYDRQRQRVHCFSCITPDGKPTEYDLFDLIGIDYNLTGKNIFLKAAELYGSGSSSGSKPQPPKIKPAQSSVKVARADETPKTDFTKYYKECNERIGQTDYLTNRGISTDVIKRFNIGYDPAYKTGAHIWKTIIIPTGKYSFNARNTDPAAADTNRYRKTGTAEIFNLKALKTAAQPIIVTEGEIDALSIETAGGTAIALGSTSNTDKFINSLKALDKKPLQPLVIALDNDTSGQTAAEKLIAELKQLNISFYRYNLYGDYKDANDALIADREEFIKSIEAATSAAAKIPRKPDNIAAYILDGDGMTTDIKKYSRCIPTGFNNLDKRSGGGLFGGLYILAATSSLGKTTFIHQIADQIAAAGTDVIYFSLEQTRLELVAKSISRTLAIHNKKSKTNNLSIRTGVQTPDIEAAKKEYAASIGDRLSIVQGDFNSTTKYIKSYIQNYIFMTETRPVVIIDYLQAIQPDPDNKSFSKKDDLDHITIELKKISGAQNIPIIAISSVNRANYLTPIDFESLKESGGIEYTADVIWGMQLKCLNEQQLFTQKENIVKKREAIKEAKRALPRRVQLVCLKNRFGISSYDCFFNYYSDIDLFEIDEAAETENDPEIF